MSHFQKRRFYRMSGVLVLCVWLLGTSAARADAPEGWRESVRQFALEHFHHPAWRYSHSQLDYALARAMAQDFR